MQSTVRTDSDLPCTDMTSLMLDEVSRFWSAVCRLLILAGSPIPRIDYSTGTVL